MNTAGKVLLAAFLANVAFLGACWLVGWAMIWLGAAPPP
jgi:hypothetical protein